MAQISFLFLLYTKWKTKRRFCFPLYQIEQPLISLFLRYIFISAFVASIHLTPHFPARDHIIQFVLLFNTQLFFLHRTSLNIIDYCFMARLKIALFYFKYSQCFIGKVFNYVLFPQLNTKFPYFYLILVSFVEIHCDK